MQKALKILSQKKLGILIVRNKKKKTTGMYHPGGGNDFCEKKVFFIEKVCKGLVIGKVDSRTPVYFFVNITL